MAIAAQELVEPGRIRFERQFGDRRAALGALPIAFVHLSLETLSAAIAAEVPSAIVIEIHFTRNLTTFLGLI
jgi:hypothetical protein